MGHVCIKWVNTKYNIADIMTKAVPAEVMIALGTLLCGYGDLKEFIKMLEASPRLYTDDNHKLGGVSCK
jgi:hypothetical protein